MNKQNAIILALQVQHRKRDTVATQLSAVHMELEDARTQLGQLEQYAHETRLAWARPGSAHGAPRAQHQEPFLRKLDNAIQYQTEAIEEIERRIATLRLQLIAAAQRIAALESLRDEQLALERLQAQRLEQRMTDEMASLRHARQSHSAFVSL